MSVSLDVKIPTSIHTTTPDQTSPPTVRRLIIPKLLQCEPSLSTVLYMLKPLISKNISRFIPGTAASASGSHNNTVQT